MQRIRRRRKCSTRSLKGCRTCRTRHIKCDETPGICNNCISTGRKCDGYDLHRLPVRERGLTLTQSVSSQPGWVTTTDERRCFSYFRHRSIPGLGVFFNSPLWHRIILQISHIDPAVYHAANMLAALHEDSDANEMRLSGENLQRARHRFALHQASRACTLLSQRQASNDPQYREVMLTSRWSIYSDDLTFESAHFGLGTPFLFTHFGIDNDMHEPGNLSLMRAMPDVHRRVTFLLNMGIPFLARCWPLSAVEVAAEYDELFQKQQQLLSLNYQFQYDFGIFCRDFSYTLSGREQQAIDVLQLQSLGQILSLKTCLIKGPVPAGLKPEYVALFSAHQEFLAKCSDRPTLTLDYGVLPGLWVVASQCPDYSIRLQAIYTLKTWPHCEEIINSNVIVSMALKKLKQELRTYGHPCSSIIDADMEEKLSRFLLDTFMLTQKSTNWSFVREADVLLENCSPRAPRSENVTLSFQSM